MAFNREDEKWEKKKGKFEGTRNIPKSQSCHILTADFRQVGNAADFGKPFAHKLGLKTGREKFYSHFSATQNCGFCEIFELQSNSRALGSVRVQGSTSELID